MENIIGGVLRRIEAELKRQQITKKAFAEALGKKEAWLHSVFSLRRQLKASDFLMMLAMLKVPCDKVLPPELSAEIGSLELSEYFSRLINKHIESYVRDKASRSTKKQLSYIPRQK